MQRCKTSSQHVQSSMSQNVNLINETLLSTPSLPRPLNFETPDLHQQTRTIDTQPVHHYIGSQVPNDMPQKKQMSMHQSLAVLNVDSDMMNSSNSPRPRSLAKFPVCEIKHQQSHNVSNKINFHRLGATLLISDCP